MILSCRQDMLEEKEMHGDAHVQGVRMREVEQEGRYENVQRVEMQGDKAGIR